MPLKFCSRELTEFPILTTKCSHKSTQYENKKVVKRLIFTRDSIGLALFELTLFLYLPHMRSEFPSFACTYFEVFHHRIAWIPSLLQEKNFYQSWIFMSLTHSQIAYKIIVLAIFKSEYHHFEFLIDQLTFYLFYQCQK